MSYEWLSTARSQFLRLSAQLPHAILIHSEPGMGKHQLAGEIVASLLCEAPLTVGDSLCSCGQCRNCTMFESGNHPDFHYISSERFVESAGTMLVAYAGRYLEPPEKRGKRKPRKVISVDQIRMLIETFSLANHSAPYKVALIEPADAMNINASNALLKLLEEPNPDSVLILVCDDVSSLPMTIRSRCVTLSLDPPTFEQSVSWLSLQGISETRAHKALAICGGAPRVALTYAQSEQVNQFEALLDALVAILVRGVGPVETREQLLKLQPPAVLVTWLQMILSWLISAAQERGHSSPCPWQAYARDFSELSRRLGASKLTALFQLYDDLLQMKKQDIDIVNPGLLLDKWLITYSRLL